MLFADPAVRCWSPAEAAVTHVRLVPSADSVQVLAVHGPHVSVSTPFQPTHRTAEQVERAEANPPSTSRLWSDWGGNAREHWSKRVTCLTVMRTAEDSLGLYHGLCGPRHSSVRCVCACPRGQLGCHQLP